MAALNDATDASSVTLTVQTYDWDNDPGCSKMHWQGFYDSAKTKGTGCQTSPVSGNVTTASKTFSFSSLLVRVGASASATYGSQETSFTYPPAVYLK
jgi:hypothetical protein